MFCLTLLSLYLNTRESACFFLSKLAYTSGISSEFVRHCFDTLLAEQMTIPTVNVCGSIFISHSSHYIWDPCYPWEYKQICSRQYMAGSTFSITFLDCSTQSAKLSCCCAWHIKYMYCIALH